MKKWGCIIFLVAGIIWACGPPMPESALMQGDQRVMSGNHPLKVNRLSAFPATGETIYKKIQLSKEEEEKIRFGKDPHLIRTEIISVAEFKRVIEAGGDLGRDEKDELVDAFIGLREKIRFVRMGNVDTEKIDLAKVLAGLPATMPQEFAMYLRGACHFAEGERGAAAEVWTALLALPPEERRNRSVWAAYMLGRLATTHDEKRERFAQARELVDGGFSDALGLALESLGWEAKSYLETGDYQKAFHFYRRCGESGADFAGDSLNRLAGRLLEEPGDRALAEAVDNGLMRRFVTGYFLECKLRIGEADLALARWLDMIERKEITEVTQAGRLAVLAYRNGDVDTAERWIGLASGGDEWAKWIRAKLLLRRGAIDDGQALLEQLYEDVTNLEWDDGGSGMERLLARELGILRISAAAFEGAMEVFLREGNWSEAAYLAETMLTSEALVGRVRRGPLAGVSEDLEDKLRVLLARRLMREGRGGEALAFYDEAIQGLAEGYLDAVRRAYDVDTSYEERALQFWEAAKRAKRDGMNLMGTELYPDFAVVDGRFHSDDMALKRRRLAGELGLRLSAEELRRLEVWEATRPERRFHYRYVAAEYAWHAASLLPNNDRLTAEILVTAGNWLKSRDPEAAERFYKALVIRCGKTRWGQRAQDLHWLPDVSE